MIPRAGNERLINDSPVAALGRKWLQRLVGKTPLTVFFDEYWERKHLFVPGVGLDDYRDLLAFAEVDAFFSRNDVRYPTVEIVKDGRKIPIENYARHLKIGSYHSEGLIDMDLVAAAYRSGATVLIQLMQNSFGAVAEFSQAVGSFLRGRVDVHAFLTPPSARGLTAHYDAASAFLIQWRGTKTWRLYELQVEVPGPNQAFANERKITGNVIDEVTLQAGDVLYLPRGLPHEGTTVSTESIHLTVVLFPTSWLDILSAILAACQENENFRIAPSAVLTNPISDHEVTEVWNTLVEQFRTRATRPDWGEFVAERHITSPRSRQGRWT